MCCFSKRTADVATSQRTSVDRKGDGRGRVEFESGGFVWRAGVCAFVGKEEKGTTVMGKRAEMMAKRRARA